MVSSLIRNQVPACRLRVRLPCPPLWPQTPSQHVIYQQVAAAFRLTRLFRDRIPGGDRVAPSRIFDVGRAINGSPSGGNRSVSPVCGAMEICQGRAKSPAVTSKDWRRKGCPL